ncbi:hypothetical protein AB0B79_40670, partial [Streptomyces sp. NPDC039022]
VRVAVVRVGVVRVGVGVVVTAGATGGSHAPLGTCVGLVFIGLGFGLMTVPQITLTMAAAPAHHSAIASGLMSAGRSTGSLIGVALLAGLPAATGITAPAIALVAVYVLMALAAVLGGRALPAGTG